MGEHDSTASDQTIHPDCRSRENGIVVEAIPAPEKAKRAEVTMVESHTLSPLKVEADIDQTTNHGESHQPEFSEAHAITELLKRQGMDAMLEIKRQPLEAVGFGFDEESLEGLAESCEDADSSPLVTSCDFLFTKKESQRRAVAAPPLVPAQAWPSEFDLPLDEDPHPYSCTGSIVTPCLPVAAWSSERNTNDVAGSVTQVGSTSTSAQCQQDAVADDGSDDSGAECDRTRGQPCTRVAADMQLLARRIAAAEPRRSGTRKEPNVSRKTTSKQSGKETNSGKDADDGKVAAKRRSKRDNKDTGTVEEVERVSRIAADLLLAQGFAHKTKEGFSGGARVRRADSRTALN